jgi:hypothetical protein
MKTIASIFDDLRLANNSQCGIYAVSEMPSVKYHKIGISELEHPMFFIRSSEKNNLKFIDCNLEYISVQYDKQCQLNHGSNTINDYYTIISLKTNSFGLQKYFIDIIVMLINELPEIPTITELRAEIDKIINLFTKFTVPPKKSIQGLWAELLIISQSNDVDYMLRSWHSNAHDRFDFNDSKDKIEVKSTSRETRVHAFSNNQLNPNKNANLIIASIFVIESGIGYGILDLKYEIENKLLDKSLCFRLNEVIADTLGSEIEKCLNLLFDIQLAIDSLRFFNGGDIPSINAMHIHKSISHVKFDCDLDDINCISKLEYKSQLHSCLLSN